MYYGSGSEDTNTLYPREVLQPLEVLPSTQFLRVNHDADGNLVSVGLLGFFSDSEPSLRITPRYPSEHHLHGRI